jgi:hypothetical protein
MSVALRQNDVYGLSQPIVRGAPTPIISRRSPAVSDFATPGTVWTNILTNQVYILASIVANSATWIQVAPGGGAGVFTSLTVTPGPTSLTGNVTMPAGNLLLTNGNITVTAGNVVLTLGDLQLNANRVITWSNGISILTGTGDPNGIVLGAQGSLYLRTDGDDVDNRAFINTDGISTWAGITTNL